MLPSVSKSVPKSVMEPSKLAVEEKLVSFGLFALQEPNENMLVTNSNERLRRWTPFMEITIKTEYNFWLKRPAFSKEPAEVMM